MYRPAARRLPKHVGRHGGLLRAVAVCVILAALICLGFHLRYQYTVSATPFWDEFFTLWSAHSIAERPISALQWGRGADAPLFRDFEALVLRAFGFNAIVARVPSIIISVATTPVLFYVGKRMFSLPAGLLACALLAFAPELVTEGARARPYALLVLLTLLSVMFFHQWMIRVGDGTQSYRGWPFVICLVAALFTQLEAILLLPGVALAAPIRHGPTVFTRKRVLGSFLACGAVVIVVLALFLAAEAVPEAIPLGETVWAETGQISLGVKNLGAFIRLFRRAPGGFALLFFVLGGLAFIAAGALQKVVQSASRSWRQPGRVTELRAAPVPEAEHARNYGLVLLCVMLLWVTAAIVFLLGPIWGSEVRYVLFLFPLLSLVVATTCPSALRFAAQRLAIGRKTIQRSLVLGLVTLGVGVIGASSLSRAPSLRQEWGYDLAFEYADDEWQEGDVTVTVAPMACLVSLGKCDYIAFQKP